MILLSSILFAARLPGAQGVAASYSSGVPTWPFWLTAAANTLIIVQILVVFAGVYQLWARREERRKAEAEAAVVALKAANYQAWQVVNSAQGKGGSGGRIDALQDLNRNGISLAGVRLDGAWLEGIQLPGAHLPHAGLREANLSGANLQGANLLAADLTDANLVGANLRGAFLKGATVKGTQFGTADLAGADLQDLRDWQAIRGTSHADIEGVRNPPAGFKVWALEHGAVDATTPSSDDVDQNYSTHFRTL